MDIVSTPRKSKVSSAFWQCADSGCLRCKQLYFPTRSGWWQTWWSLKCRKYHDTKNTKYDLTNGSIPHNWINPWLPHSVVVSVASGQARSQPAAVGSTGNRVSGSRFPMPDCQKVVPRLSRHAVEHLLWYALPQTACWICKKQFGKPNTLQLHWNIQHPTVKQALNWGSVGMMISLRKSKTS